MVIWFIRFEGWFVGIIVYGLVYGCRIESRK